MLKHIVAIIVISVAVIVGMSYAQQALQALMSVHHWFDNLLTQVFSVGEAGNIIRQLIAMLTIPVVVALIPTIIYWLARRHWFAYFMNVVWVVWLMEVAVLVIQYKA